MNAKANIVAVTMRLAPAVAYHEERDAISHDWITLLMSMGLVPILVPNIVEEPAEFLSETGVSRILLTNGGSMGALSHDEGCPCPSARDRLEFRLLDIAIEKNLPVLGVCRGLQVINSYFGGSLTRKLETVSGENHVASPHAVYLESGEILADVNSFHEQGVMVDQIAENLKVTAKSKGGVVEALQHKSLPIFAIQWHPERMGSACFADEKVFYLWTHS